MELSAPSTRIRKCRCYGRSGTCSGSPAPSSAVRLLPARTDHAGSRPAQAISKTDRSANHRRDVRQYLSLRHLSAHSRRHQSSGGVDAMTVIENLSRRDVIKGAAIASGMVLGAYVGFREFPLA